MGKKKTDHDPRKEPEQQKRIGSLQSGAHMVSLSAHHNNNKSLRTSAGVRKSWAKNVDTKQWRVFLVSKTKFRYWITSGGELLSALCAFRISSPVPVIIHKSCVSLYLTFNILWEALICPQQCVHVY